MKTTGKRSDSYCLDEVLVVRPKCLEIDAPSQTVILVSPKLLRIPWTQQQKTKKYFHVLVKNAQGPTFLWPQVNIRPSLFLACV